MKNILLLVNGKTHQIEVRDAELLIETLRDRLGFKGTKYSCLEGDCGACTVLVDGKNMLSCLLLTCDVQGRAITTIEALASGSELHPIQQAFIDAGAVQCGFCTPGMILASKALLDKTPEPSEEEILHALDGNLCRCTGYIKIVDAVKAVSKKLKK